MDTAPRTLTEAARGAVTKAAQTAVDAQRGFRPAIDFARDCHLADAEIWQICKTAGLDEADVLALLERPTL